MSRATARHRVVAVVAAALTFAATPVVAEYGFDLRSSGTGDEPASASNLAARGDRLQTGTTTPPPSICQQRKAFLIGDSLTVGSIEFGDLDDILLAAGYLVRIDARQSRFTDGGANRLRDESASGALEQLVVVALGTNDAAAGFTTKWFSDNIDRAMAAVGPRRTVLWVNLQLGDLTRQTRFNDVLKLKSFQYPNLLVLDWASQPTRSYLTSDGIHLSPTGYRIRAAYTKDRIDWVTCRRLPY